MENLENFKYIVEGVLLVILINRILFDSLIFYFQDCDWLCWTLGKPHVSHRVLSEDCDEMFPLFDADAGNIRLGLHSDGNSHIWCSKCLHGVREGFKKKIMRFFIKNILQL